MQFDKRLLWLLPALAVGGVLLGAYLASLPSARDVKRRSPCRALGVKAVKELAKRTPEIALRDLAGKVRKLSELRGRLVLVNFWNTTCEPCIREIPSLVALAGRYRSEGLVLLMVATDRKIAPINEARKRIRELASLPPNAIVLHDPGGTIAKEYGTVKWPETYLITPQGRVAGKVVGERNWSGKIPAACVFTRLP